MTTWRERIAEARARGSFSPEDWRVWRSPFTCLIGEAAAVVGWGKIDRLKRLAFPESDDLLTSAQKPIYAAMVANDFAAVDSLLDRIEDGVLQIKREATT